MASCCPRFKQVLTGPLAVKGHNPLNVESKGSGSESCAPLSNSQSLLQGISAAGQLCLQQLFVFVFSKLRVFPCEASQAKGNEKGLSLEQELGHIFDRLECHLVSLTIDGLTRCLSRFHLIDSGFES